MYAKILATNLLSAHPVGMPRIPPSAFVRTVNLALSNALVTSTGMPARAKLVTASVSSRRSQMLVSAPAQSWGSPSGADFRHCRNTFRSTVNRVSGKSWTSWEGPVSTCGRLLCAVQSILGALLHNAASARRSIVSSVGFGCGNSQLKLCLLQAFCPLASAKLVESGAQLILAHVSLALRAPQQHEGKQRERFPPSDDRLRQQHRAVFAMPFRKHCGNAT